MTSDRIIAAACPTHWPNAKWRTCQTCAAIRQARIADAADNALRAWSSHALVVITPHAPGAAALAAAKAKYLRQARLPAGIWTVERGSTTGDLHINVLAPPHQIPHTRGTTIHAQIIRAPLRAVAAYISKPRQYPTETEYNGHIYGQLRHLRTYLAAPNLPAVPLAAYTEQHILRDYGPAGLADPRWRHTLPTAKTLTDAQHDPTLTWADYREIARRHLPKLSAIADTAGVTPRDPDVHQKR